MQQTVNSPKERIEEIRIRLVTIWEEKALPGAKLRPAPSTRFRPLASSYSPGPPGLTLVPPLPSRSTFP